MSEHPAHDRSGDVVLGVAYVPGGVELRLVGHGDHFTILLENNELMSTLASASEEDLAYMTLQRLGPRPSPGVLVGGYGMGYTLRAALAELASDATVIVAEIVPEIISWARGPMQRVTAGCLDDPRVTVVDEDVAMLIRSARDGYDVILLDVDNGPESLTRDGNDNLYSLEGLQYAWRALTPYGMLAIWSAWADEAFTARLDRAGFETVMVSVTAKRNGRGWPHVIWFARKRG